MENRTLEAPPEGTVNVFVRAEGAREARVKWGAPLHPNGLLTYSVLVTGTFYADPGNLCAILRCYYKKIIYFHVESSSH